MKTRVQFHKMHGLGNDFAIIETLSQQVPVEKIPIPQLSDRHCGIGFDQLLVIQPSEHSDFYCRIFNADGSEAEQCGNGMRCVARFIIEEKLSLKNHLTLVTKSGIIEASVTDFNSIKINMNSPIFESQKEIIIHSQVLKLFPLSMGNPHAILAVQSVKDAPVSEWGPLLSTHTFFTQGANIGFMEIVNRQHIRLRTFERGSAETLACGSNSCAAVAVGIMNNELDNKVKVELALGNIWVEWKGQGHPLFMTGPAERVYSGYVEI